MKRLLLVSIVCLTLALFHPLEARSAAELRTPITPESASRVAEIEQLGRGTPESLVWSPDGQLLAVGSSTGIWLHNAQQLDADPHRLPTESDSGKLFFSADGAYLVSANQLAIDVWDVSLGKLLLELPSTLSGWYPMITDPRTITLAGQPFDLSIRNGYLRSGTSDQLQIFVTSKARDFASGDLSVSPDEQFLLFTAKIGTPDVQLWAVKTGQKVADLPVSASDRYLWSPDSQYVYNRVFDSTSPNGGALFRTSDGNQAWKNIGSGSCDIVSWSPDNHRLALACDDNRSETFMAIDVVSGQTIASYNGQHDWSDKLVEFSTDSQSIFLYGSLISDRDLVQWHFLTGSAVTIAPAQVDQARFFNTLAIQPGDHFAAVSGSDNVVRVFDIASRIQKTTLRYSAPQVSVIFTPDSQRLISGSSLTGNEPGDDVSIFAWDLNTAKVLSEMNANQPYVSLDISANGKFLLSSGGYYDWTAILWNLDNYSQVEKITDSYSQRLFSPRAGFITSTDPKQEPLYLYHLKSAPDLKMLTPTGLVSRNATFSNDGKLFLSQNIVYKTGSYAPLAQIGKNSDYFNVAISPDDQLLAKAEGHSANVSLWNLRTLSMQAQWQVHYDRVTGEESTVANPIMVAFSPDGRILAAGGGYNLLLIDVVKKVILRRVETQGQIYCLAFSPDGTMIATGSNAGNIQIWGVAGP